MIHYRRDPLWKRIMAALEVRAVRMLFIGPQAPLDPRVEQARKQGQAVPMPKEFLDALKAVLELLPRKEELFTALKTEGDAQMAEVWQKLWRTKRGKEYKELRDIVDRKKERINTQAKQLEDGIYRKILAGNRAVSYIKGHVLVGNEDLIDQAAAEVERIKGELEQAKAQLAQLRKAKADQLVRINTLVVEELGQGAAESSIRIRRSSIEEVQQAIMDYAAIDEIGISEVLERIDVALDALVSECQHLATLEANGDDFEGLMPEDESADQAVEAP